MFDEIWTPLGNLRIPGIPAWDAFFAIFGPILVPLLVPVLGAGFGASLNKIY